MEDKIGVQVFARYQAGPQLLHEEHLVGELWWCSWYEQSRT